MNTKHVMISISLGLISVFLLLFLLLSSPYAHAYSRIPDTTLTSSFPTTHQNDANDARQTQASSLSTALTPITWTLSFDSPSTYIKRLAVYDDNLYAGGFDPGQNDGRLYQYDGNAWIEINFASAIGVTVDLIESLQVFNNRLYIGTRVDVGGNKFVRVYYYDGGTFALDLSKPGQSGYSGIESFAVYSNTLYATNSSPVGEVYQRNSDNDWTTLGGTIETGSPVRSLALYNGSLYADTGGPGDQAKVWRWTGGSWVLAKNLTTDFVAAQDHDGVTSLASLNGNIYVGPVGPSFTTPVVVYDGTTWTISTTINCGYTELDIIADELWASGCFGQVYRLDGSLWTAMGNIGGKKVSDLAQYGDFVYASPFNSGYIFSTVNTIDEMTNDPPTVQANGPYSVGEGDSVVVTVSGSDPDGDALTYAWDLNDSGDFETPGQSATFSAAALDGPSGNTSGFYNTSFDSPLWFEAVLGSGPTVTVLNDRLEISIPADSTDDTNDSEEALFRAGYMSTCRLSGDFDMQVDFDLPVWPFANGVRVGLVTILDPLERPVQQVNRVSFGTAQDFGLDPREVYLNNLGYGMASITPTSDVTGTLRLVRNSGIMTAYYFDTGDWVLLNTEPVNAIDIPFGLFAWSADYAFTDQDVEVVFENFVLNEGQLVCPDQAHLITVQAMDSGGLSATDQTAVSVLNVAPTAVFSNTSSIINAGESATLVFSNQFDPSTADTVVGFRYFYDCTDDGVFEVTDASAMSFTCNYPDDGVYTARGRIKDKDNGFTDYVVDIQVNEDGSAFPFAVTATNPEGNGRILLPTHPISATFNHAINTSSVTISTFTVRGQQTGTYDGNYTFASLQSARFDAAGDFRPGEEIVVTLGDGLQATDGTALIPYSWQFRAGVDGSSGMLADSGQTLGNSNSFGVALGDLDGDNDLDAFVANTVNHANKVWLNDGVGTFSDSGQSLGNSDSYGIALGDLDNDGDLDAFVGNITSQANKVWLNDGTGFFSDSGQSLGAFFSYGVALGDVDGDGDLDAFAANNAGQANKLWLYDGAGNFSESGQDLGNSNSTGVMLGDIDGDGDLDAFVVNQNQPNKVWLNDGTGIFSDSGQNLGNANSFSVALGDMDSDGDLDAFVVNSTAGPQANKVYLNDGAGMFSDSGQNLGDSFSQGVALGDIDGDSDLDAFVNNILDQPNEVWLNDGTGIFTDSGQSLGILYSQRMALGDIDGDGDIDAFVANWTGQPNKVWLNDDPSMPLTVTNTSPPDNGQIITPTGVISTSFNQAINNSTVNTNTFTVRGQQTGIYEGNYTFGSLQSTQFDSTSDFKPGEEIVVTLSDELQSIDGTGLASYTWQFRTAVNKGTGFFSDSGQNLGGSGSLAVALGDLDRDGDVDAFVANWLGEANKIWLNNGAGIFTDSGQSLGSSNSFSVDLGDVDNDGDLDAIVGNLNEGDEVWLNDGTGVFSDIGQDLGSSWTNQWCSAGRY